MYSQSNEDEIIAEIFGKIGVTNKRFVEFGCGDGRQNNTILLLHQGWSGIWLEPHRKRVRSARERFAGYPVEIRRKLVIPRIINKIITEPLDLLSIDIDGNDLAVWAALEAKPRLVCIEYDAIHGSTLDAMVGLGKAKGYHLECCSTSDVNAFFVRNDLETGD